VLQGVSIDSMSVGILKDVCLAVENGPVDGFKGRLSWLGDDADVGYVTGKTTAAGS
jgi:hypothetical protein